MVALLCFFLTLLAAAFKSKRRPIVLTSPMDGSPQVVRFDATTLWHLDAAEWAPSTASNSVTAAMSAARPLFHRKRKSTRDLAMSQKCQEET
jgi:hypothetical protein